jgi:predicted nicotinamide N-methyase
VFFRKRTLRRSKTQTKAGYRGNQKEKKRTCVSKDGNYAGATAIQRSACRAMIFVHDAVNSDKFCQINCLSATNCGRNRDDRCLKKDFCMLPSLKDEYHLGLTPLAICGKKLVLHTVDDWDIFVEGLAQKGDAYIEHFPFWVKIWEASIVLADHLMNISLPKNVRVLEVGAGVGVTGLFLGACGYDVTITDYKDGAIALLKKNVAYNKLTTVSVKKLDWNKPELNTRFDIIIGSELIYNEKFIVPLIALFRKYLRPHGTVFLAHDYTRKCLMQFISMISGRFEIQNVIKTMKSRNENYRIVVHTLHIH